MASGSGAGSEFKQREIDMVTVSIVIPNYNGIKYLEECFASLFAQKDAPDYRVILVDNGSEDESVEWTREHYPQIQIITLPENTGFCHAVNVGIKADDGEYVILLNNDTKCRPYFVKALYEAISKDETGKLFSVSARMLCWQDETLLDGAGDRYCALGWAFARGKLRKADKYDTSVKIFSSCGGAAIYSRKILEKIGLFDEAHFAYLEDMDLGYRAKINGYENRYEPGAEVIHYGSATSGSRYNPWKVELAAANSVYVVYKNMPFLQWLWNVPFLFLGKLVKWLFFVRKKMGKAYLRGIGKGWKKSFSKEGRKNKVRFRWRNLGHYFGIQWQLYVNLFRYLIKS